MPFLQKFCFGVPLRCMCFLLGYALLAQPCLNFVWLIMQREYLCARLTTLWIFADLFNVLSSFLLLGGLYMNSISILPLHIVSKLIGLIVEMICHLLIAAVEMGDRLSITTSVFSIGCTCLDVLVVLRFYQQEE
ncbi:uncharacterized protein LOC117584386 [Drosophila guanche]|uniref:Uncharacterized protein n=1 Tax=Drosophila guanche TaxID=7266 RepID=A0A3B0JN94_DROGU|nr:uncharacterized protein LOC117584386 [Drosophila guanche]SPP81822.1 Hypothetical predicted protein [Drosophila guanche]